MPLRRRTGRAADSGKGHSPTRLMITVLSYDRKRIVKLVLVDRGIEPHVMINSLKGEKHGR